MNKLLAYLRPRVYRDCVTHVRRSLIGHGNILVKVGQEVSPEHILAEEKVLAGFHIIHLAHDLDLAPKEAIKKIKRDMGKIIYQGEILAERDAILGMGKKLLLSPVDGVIEFYDSNKGDLKIKLLPKSTKLASGVYGIVDAVDLPTSTVVIRTLATTIYGVLGFGKGREGPIKVVGSGEDLISSKQISPDLKGQIVVGGGIIFLDALKKALSCGVCGVISGGIGSGDYKAIAGSGYPRNILPDNGITMLITEGFGAVPIASDIFSAIRAHDGKYAFIDGHHQKLVLPSQNQNCMMYIRRCSLPLSLSEIGPTKEMAELQVGQIIRMTTSPYLGITGRVENIDKTESILPSGVRTVLVTVATSSKKIRVPYQNVEILGCK